MFRSHEQSHLSNTWYKTYRDIKVSKNRNLVEVKGDSKEAIFQIVGENDKFEIVKVGSLLSICLFL